MLYSLSFIIYQLIKTFTPNKENVDKTHRKWRHTQLSEPAHPSLFGYLATCRLATALCARNFFQILKSNSGQS